MNARCLYRDETNKTSPLLNEQVNYNASTQTLRPTYSSERCHGKYRALWFVVKSSADVLAEKRVYVTFSRDGGGNEVVAERRPS